ncbi:winged helix-turn-helix domain-containing protein [Acrocarpospora sp. B8E8]|uniref:ATP-binding protein n=1 Tax=Acrocarpospora sp. B8E8 TaxID=3153572 RepID=UPI00325D45B1
MAVYTFGNRRLDLDARELSVDGAVVHLEPQVFDVLAYLVANRDRMISKTELLDAVWRSQFVAESTLTSRIKSARRAIGDDGTSQLLIRTQRGRGYRFVGTVAVDDAAPALRFEPQWSPTGLLPSARVEVIGRVEDIQALGRLLLGHRVVTISGPGGVGKSTLALELARRRVDEHGPEVAFVELAPVHHASDLVRAVAEATGVEGAGAAEVAVLAANLAPRRLLLVLDNCEHLLEASAELVDRLLDAGPGIHVLTTSREPLGVDGEAVHVLGSLGRDARTLFVERAAAAAGRTTLTADDPQVVELCERLDGLPLAIELAAAQLRHLALGDLTGMLDDRLGLLVGGRPRAGERHLTLARTIEWSQQLLSGASREMFVSLGVFPAGFDLPAVQAISGGSDLVAAARVVGDLVGKSLVVHDHGSRRYRLLETIRLFAQGRLETSGRHAELTERLRRHIVGRMTARSRQQVWLSASLAARNRDDIDNVRAAFDASLARGRFTDAVDIMIGLSSLWRNAASYADGLRWTADLRHQDLAPRDRLWLHIVEADLGLGSGNPRLMADAAAAAAELSTSVEDPAADVIVRIYWSLSLSSHPDRAVAGLEAARDEARDIGELELHRLARAFRVVALLTAGRRTGLQAEISELTTAAATGYDRYICIWAAWADALADRDGPALRRWMDRQADSLRSTGLQENWVTLFCHALARIADGADYLPHLSQARRRAEAEGRRADPDCVLALAYAAACRGEPILAAELVGASGGVLFHDTANFLHHMIIRDHVVRPMLDATSFQEAIARGRERPVAAILSEHRL